MNINDHDKIKVENDNFVKPTTLKMEPIGEDPINFTNQQSSYTPSRICFYNVMAGKYYLSREVIAGFDRYKYSSIDNSPLSNYVTHPFWNRLVTIVPLWVAPNLLTFLGFLNLILHFIVLSIYDFHFYASSDSRPEYSPIPNWVWLFCSVCIFISHHLDGIDGKQARRTNSSTPLGELFDHGLDSWATVFFTLGIYSVFGRADYSINVYRFFIVLITVQSTFIFSHWEKYNTGYLFLPWSYDISQIALTVSYLITFIWDYKLWKQTVPLFGINLGDVFEICMYVSFFAMSCPVTFYNLYKSYRDKTGENHSFYEGVRPLQDDIIMTTLFFIWAWTSPNKILELTPRIFLVTMGTVFSNITCKLIISQMSKTRCNAGNLLLYPLSIIVITQLFFKYTVKVEVALLYIYGMISLICHIHFGVGVVKQMAQHLEIDVFSIHRKPKLIQPNGKSTK